MTFTPSSEQAAIINAPLAPLRVAAGAGTGKTTTVAHRVAALVTEHNIAPGRILGITFTNKAAFELTDKIRTVLGAADPSESVEIHTYHGFASQLLADHGALVGVERSAQIITPTFGRQLLFEAIRRAEFSTVDITARRHIIPALLKLESDLSDNLKTAQDLISATPDQPDEIMVQRREMAGALRNYQAYKKALDVLDYGDLVRLAYRLVSEFSEVANSVAGRYQSVVLDEYQDTNPAQRLLLQSLFTDGAIITAVGDLDQTIYEWRGASLGNFRDFPKHFPNEDGSQAATLPLSVNRRSGRLILDVANAVRLNISDGGGTPLVPHKDNPSAAVAAAWLRTAGDEANLIADEARRLHDDGFAWKDMAVLFRKNKDIALVRDAMDDHEIPVQVANLGGLLGIPEIVEIHAWLRLIASPEDGPALARLLSGTRYRLGMVGLKALTDWAQARSKTDPYAVDHEAVPAHTLVEALDNVDELNLDEDIRSRLREFADTYLELVTLAQGVALIELVRQILTVTDAWNEIDAMPEAARLSARLNVYRFLDLAEDWSPLEGRPSLEAFLAYLSLMMEEEIEELDTARVGTDDAITLLTVHRAKGLEWPVVFIPAVYHNNFPSRVRSFDDPYARPAVLPDDLRLDRDERPRIGPDMDVKERRAILRAAHEDQEWRLAYVAVTRAQQHLILSGASWYGNPEPNMRPVKPSALLELVRGLEHVTTAAWIDDPQDRPPVVRASVPGPGPDPHFGMSWDAAMRATITNPSWTRTRAESLGVTGPYDDAVDEFQTMLFSLPESEGSADRPDPITRASVTGLVTYATCPKRYFWSEVDRLPRRPSTAARRGVELHRKIEIHNRGNIPLDDIDEIVYDTTPDGRDDAEASTAGRPNAFKVFKTSRFGTVLPVHVEMPFDLRVSEGVWVRGRIDAIYPHSENGWEVVDFKSGRNRNDPAATVQLQAYAMAVTAPGFSAAPPDPLKVTFAYFGDGLDEVSQDVDGEWLENAQDRLGELFGGIEAQDWTPTPSPACHHCDFQRFCEPGKEWVAANSD